MRNVFSEMLRTIAYACNTGNVLNHKDKACERNCRTAIEEGTNRIVSHGPAKANCSLRLSIIIVFLHVHVYVYMYMRHWREANWL